MAEQRATRAARNAQSKGGNGSKETQFEVDQLFDDIERTARTWLQSFGTWINQGDELLTKGREWVEEHPVALGVAKKYGRKLSFIPTTLEEARESARTAANNLRDSASRGVSTVKARPLDTAVIGAALGVAAFVLIRNR